jgi:hypothetical protein
VSLRRYGCRVQEKKKEETMEHVWECEAGLRRRRRRRRRRRELGLAGWKMRGLNPLKLGSIGCGGRGGGLNKAKNETNKQHHFV